MKSLSCYQNYAKLPVRTLKNNIDIRNNLGNGKTRSPILPEKTPERKHFTCIRTVPTKEYVWH